MQSQINSLKGDLKNEIQNTIKSQQAVMMNQQTTFQNNLQNMICGLFQNQASTSGTLPSNTIPNPKGEMKAITTRSGVAYEGPSIPTSHFLLKGLVGYEETEETTDKEQTNFQGNLRFDISFADALLLMLRFAPTIKSLLMNKEKLLELAKIPLNENCSVMLLKKLPEKLGDPSKFLIPCDFPGMDVCHALADLSASINLMPISIWKKLSLPELTPTWMTLELADRSITRPKGVAEDVFVKVGSFHFPTDFVVVDFEADPRRTSTEACANSGLLSNAALGFYRRFIQDFSKIARPMTHLLEKETPFVFSKDCIDAFQTLKKKLTEAPILVVPDWNLPFEFMCDASDFAIGAVLGQRKMKYFQPIHYASRTITEAQIHYTTFTV
ncbi:reverse transcriptase domain-containing protein [Tanacetum coccineum]